MMTTMAKAFGFSVIVILFAFLHFETCTAQEGRGCQITPTEGMTLSGPRILELGEDFSFTCQANIYYLQGVGSGYCSPQGAVFNGRCNRKTSESGSGSQSHSDQIGLTLGIIAICVAVLAVILLSIYCCCPNIISGYST